MKKSIFLLYWIAIFALFMNPQVCSADRYTDVESVSPQEVADGMGQKLTRGIANLATGWCEFPKQIYITAQEDGWGRGMTVGPVKGVVMTLTRTVTGAAEILTFFVPYPGFYEPFFDPPYVWMKE